MYAPFPINFYSLPTVFVIRHAQGVGLKLDDAISFWKAEFSQKVSWYFGYNGTLNIIRVIYLIILVDCYD